MFIPLLEAETLTSLFFPLSVGVTHVGQVVREPFLYCSCFLSQASRSKEGEPNSRFARWVRMSAFVINGVGWLSPIYVVPLPMAQLPR